MKSLINGVLAVGLVAVFSTASRGATVVTTFPGSVFNPDAAIMNAALGIAGAAIEDFEDTLLLTGLEVAFANPASGPTATLPANFAFASAWEGTNVLINRADQANVAPYEDVIFHVPAGTTSFGVGLSDFQTALNETRLLVNGADMGLVSALPNYADGAIRNLYLLLSTEVGDAPITTVTFQMLARNDAILFDHVALGAEIVPPPVIPLPPAVFIALPIMVAIGWMKRSRIE